MNLNYLSIRGISYRLASFIARQKNESHSQKSIYYYSLQIIIGSFIKLFLMLIISFAIGIIKEVIICMFVFTSIRIYSGGFHADTYLKCTLYSLIIIIGTSYIAGYLFNFYFIWINILIFVLVLYITYFYAPKDHQNKPILSETHRKKLKIKAFIINLIWFLISTCLLINYSYALFASIIGLSALVEALTLTPLFFKGTTLIDNCCAKLAQQNK